MRVLTLLLSAIFLTGLGLVGKGIKAQLWVNFINSCVNICDLHTNIIFCSCNINLINFLGAFMSPVLYKLIPTKDWPALMIDGILMHRIKDTSPKADAEAKIKILGINKGDVLDICTGLGYAAIVAARHADKVVTIEKDPKVIDIAKKNPASRELFENKKIKLIIGDACDEIKKFPNNAFDFIIHDPPRFALAGELYSLAFYTELFRLLKTNGKMFHYIGLPGERYRNKGIRKGIIERLCKAGFEVKSCEKLQGVLCFKSKIKEFKQNAF